ncbi:MAG: HAD family hydrolase [Chloroflexi bacterium]|nr:HAD family hydrolase [Chloroflexota bacterium]
MASEIRAVLFDVGGPLDTEQIMDHEIDEQIILSFRNHGLDLSNADYAVANTWAIEVFAPNTYRSIIWKIANGDTHLADIVEAELIETVPLRNKSRGDIELREGIPGLLKALTQRNLLLGLAANQPRQALANMEQAGILKYFKYQEVSGSTGLRKPDPRLFLQSCEGLGVAPNEAIMVGDRIDNDIAPAKTLGMIAIRFVTGRHSEQRPRSRAEMPDADVRSVEELERVIGKFVNNPPNSAGDGGPE